MKKACNLSKLKGKHDGSDIIEQLLIDVVIKNPKNSDEKDDIIVTKNVWKDYESEHKMCEKKGRST